MRYGFIIPDVEKVSDSMKDKTEHRPAQLLIHIKETVTDYVTMAATQ
jgi:hypothetical protein